MENIEIIIEMFEDRYKELEKDKSARFLRPTLKEIIERLEDNDIIGAYNVANKSLEKADDRDKIKIGIYIEYMELKLENKENSKKKKEKKKKSRDKSISQ